MAMTPTLLAYLVEQPGRCPVCGAYLTVHAHGAGCYIAGIPGPFQHRVCEALRSAGAGACDNYRSPLTCLTAPSTTTSRCRTCELEAARRAVIEADR